MNRPRVPYSDCCPVAPIPGAPALQVRSLSVAYPWSSTLAVDEVCLRVPVGVRVALIGPNGAGKSTLFKVIAGLLRIHSGEIRVPGHPVGACRHSLAYLPQRGEVDWRFPISGRKLVLTGRYVHLGWLRRPGQQDRAIAAEVLERLGLSILADRRIGQLSVGQQQRALLARALAQHADLLLLDEPLNAVDAKTRTVISDLWREFQRRGKTVVVATHDLGRLAAQRSSSPYDAPLLADRGGLRSGRALYLVLRQRAVRRSYRARLQCLLRAGMADPGTPRAMGR